MPRPPLSVTVQPPQTDRLPDWATPGAALLLSLLHRGRLDALERRLQIRRHGGYAASDVWLFLLYFFASALPLGLKTFWTRAARHSRTLAALAGRRSLPSPAALSRALASVQTDLLRPALPALLLEDTGADELLRHPATLTYDAQGHGWHLFDYDATATVLRQRALPAGTDFPPPLRHSRDLLAGYAGHKRGEVQFRRATLQHAGTGLWLDARLAPGNGHRRAELPAAIDIIHRTCQVIGHPLERAILRGDGEFGWVPDLTTYREKGVSFITRLTRPTLLDQPEVRRRLLQTPWHLVPDAHSGPQRSAADLGRVTVCPGLDTVREEGQPYDPVVVRVVVSRFPRTEEAEHGRVIAGWQYELFVTDLTPEAWPAEAIVAGYFGRTGQENRFAQEDRELGLDRIFSYHLPGQELASVVGLMVWNLQIVQGFLLDRPPESVETAAEESGAIDPRPVTLPPPASPVPEEIHPVDAAQLAQAEAAMVAQLEEVEWTGFLQKKPGWKWSGAEGGLVCPAGQTLVLTCVSTRSRAGRGRLYFRTSPGECGGCERRASCLRSEKPRALKKIDITVEPAVAERLAAPLAALQQLRSRWLGEHRRKRARTTVHPLAGAAVSAVEGRRRAIRPSLFLPAAARRLFRATLEDLTVRVVVSEEPMRAPHPLLVARSIADRQHRRQTWAQHVARYALPASATVNLTLAGGERWRACISGLDPGATVQQIG